MSRNKRARKKNKEKKNEWEHRQKWPFADRQNAADKILVEKLLIFLLGAAPGKCQVIVDVDSRNLEARSFIYTEVEKKKTEKKNWTFRGCVWWRGTSSEQEASLAWKVCRTRVVISVAFLVALLASFTDWSGGKLLICLALRKDLPIGKMNHRCRKFVFWFQSFGLSLAWQWSWMYVFSKAAAVQLSSFCFAN